LAIVRRSMYGAARRRTQEEQMLDSTRDRGIEREPSDATTSVKEEWHPPTITFLGDARTLTEAGGVFSPDGPATSALS
jgi:hypothetical protein